MGRDARISIWIPNAWGAEKKTRILAALRDFSPQFTERAAIGAGATGLQPELSLLVEVAKLLAAGFIGAVGGDVWTRLKAAVVDLSKVKPDHHGQQLPREIVETLPLNGELIWYVQFTDRTVLITISLAYANTSEALSELPRIVDALAGTESGNLRLWWDGREWKH